MTLLPHPSYRWRLFATVLLLMFQVGGLSRVGYCAVQESARALPPAARYKDFEVSFEELDALVLSRYADSKLGRETRLFMLKLRVVDDLASELGVVAESAEIQSMLEEVERGLLLAGGSSDIDQYLLSEGVSRAEFQESLRLAVLQAKLARRGLGIPPGDPVSGEQQEMWLDARIAERGLEEFPAPWADGIVLRNGNVTLQRGRFLTFLRNRLEAVQVNELLESLLRVKVMKARMPDLDPGVLEQAVQREIENRRRDVSKDPKYKGLGYEQLLASQGILVDTWPQDPSIVQAVLARLWVQRNHDQDSLRGVYENERAYFDAEYGEALEAYVLYLRAAEFPNELIPRDHSMAEKELLALSQDIQDRDDFLAAVELHSEDRVSRERKGYLGWVTRTGTSGPSPARSALFGALDSGAFKATDPPSARRRLIGPVRTSTGVLLLWAGDRRPKPSWTTMMLQVHKTLRQRFVDDSLDPALVTTFLQPE